MLFSNEFSNIDTGSFYEIVCSLFSIIKNWYLIIFIYFFYQFYLFNTLSWSLNS